MAEHNITPPPELRRQWLDNDHFPMVTGTNDLLYMTRDRLNSVMDQAVQWGADMELEACCEWTQGYAECGDSLRAARRPKPPSLKEQALELVDRIEKAESIWAMSELETIRRALEALPE